MRHARIQPLITRCSRSSSSSAAILGAVRVPDLRRAQDLGLDAGPHRPQPRRPVRACCKSLADGAQVPPQGRHHPAHVDKVLFLLAPCIAHDRRPCSSFAVVPFGADRRSARAPDYVDGVSVRHRPGRRHRHPVHLRRRQPGGVRHHPRRLGVEQQVQRCSASLRSSAQIISYEIPLGMSILGVVLLAGSLNLETDHRQQADGGIWLEHLVPAAGVPALHDQRRSPSATACRSTCPRPSRNSSAATTPSTARMKFAHVLPRRIHAHDHDQLPDGDPVLRRLALPVARPTSTGIARAWS